jgi:histidinol dehydrogenase
MKTLIWNDIGEIEKKAICLRPASEISDDVYKSVQKILNDVQMQGDEALRFYTEKFDGYGADNFLLSVPDIEQALAILDPNLKSAIDNAFNNIQLFHAQQGYKPYSIEITKGITCQRVVVPVESIGLYIPGGTAPLFSTVLMLGIPSLLAGNPNRILCTPANSNGMVHPAIIYAAGLCGITKIARLGGAQAIAAMAYGTQTIPRVSKIFGPGNMYVTLAKTLCAQQSNGPAIDMPAGPSEVLVIVDEQTPDAFAAADLLAQAEHDINAQVVLVAPSLEKITRIQNEVNQQLQKLPRAGIASKALENSMAIVADTMDQAMDISNIYAPEHLILCFNDADRWVDKITNAGSVFVGVQTPESLGDYASGTNHVLPTGGCARAYSGLSVESFQKTITVQKASEHGLFAIAPTVITMAEAETLDAHANAVQLRVLNACDTFAKNTLIPAVCQNLMKHFAVYKAGQNISIQTKNDGTPASDADRETEKILRSLIKQEYPDHGIAGEEFGIENPQSDYIWVLDPLDGTREFLAQKSGWGNLIALLYKGRPVLGFITDPQQAEPVKGFVACTCPEAMFDNTAYELGARKYFKNCDLQRDLNCMGFAYVASGHIDIAIEQDLKLHDIAALLSPLWGSGCLCYDLNGQDYKNHVFDVSATRTYSLVTSRDQSLVFDAIEKMTGVKP